ncbi:MAG: 4-oxalocrotonate tautomerase [Myxococcaceae bacterium]|nr:4-oxalocrotonate tautomerase [Myxococcaceae bacterium]
MQFKIFGRTSFLRAAHTQISEVVHAAAMRTLQAPADKRFHRFIPLEDWQLVVPDDRSARYLLLEVILFSGRTLETKKALVRALMDDLSRALALDPRDIEVVLLESPREHWGIRGQHGDELKLPYKVEL